MIAAGPPLCSLMKGGASQVVPTGVCHKMKEGWAHTASKSMVCASAGYALLYLMLCSYKSRYSLQCPSSAVPCPAQA